MAELHHKSNLDNFSFLVSLGIATEIEEVIDVVIGVIRFHN